MLGDDPDVGVGGEVHDRLAVLHRPAERVVVEEVTDHGVDLVGRVMRRVTQVVDPRLDPCIGELVHDVGADEAGPAGDHDASHDASPVRAVSFKSSAGA